MQMLSTVAIIELCQVYNLIEVHTLLSRWHRLAVAGRVVRNAGKISAEENI